MKELIAKLVASADPDEAQATKVAEVVKAFLATKLPEPLRGPEPQLPFIDTLKCRRSLGVFGLMPTTRSLA